MIEKRRHVYLNTVLNSTHIPTENFSHSRNAAMAYVYVASNNSGVEMWFGGKKMNIGNSSTKKGHFQNLKKGLV